MCAVEGMLEQGMVVMHDPEGFISESSFYMEPLTLLRDAIRVGKFSPVMLFLLWGFPYTKNGWTLVEETTRDNCSEVAAGLLDLGVAGILIDLDG